VRLSAALAAGADGRVSAELRQASRDVDPVEVDEAVLQSCLFLGFPAALEAAAEWRCFREGAPEDGDPLALPDREEERRVRGESICREIYGSAYEALRRNVADASPALDRLMVDVGYGAVLGRPGLDPIRRELCLVAVLAVQGRDRQLHSHLRGALRMGAPPDWVSAALDIGLEQAPPAAHGRLRQLWREVLERRETTGEGERSPDVH
jgi:4-carboxymuconolactone decarboxylase